MMNLFQELSQECSRATTRKYSTSFSSAIKLLHSDLQVHIYNIYGFVRLADEIVDTFHDYKQSELLNRFKADTYHALEERISLNPILHSFQTTVNKYQVSHELIDAFFKSMEMDLGHGSHTFNHKGYTEYIYGSAEVVGLMCLCVFCEGRTSLYNALKPAAQSLGAAFQKVNFLRDAKMDMVQLNRTYFPGVDFDNFTNDMKSTIESEISNDFADAYKGIRALPVKARFGVYVAYQYYLSLFRKIKNAPSANFLEKRIRIPNYGKAFILAKAGLRSQLNIL